MQNRASPLIGLRVRYLMAIDLVCILAAVMFAFMIRYEALVSLWPYLERNWTFLVVAPLVRLPVYYATGLYNRLWRYASMAELRIILLVGVLCTLLIGAVNFWLLAGLEPWLPAAIRHMPSRSVWLTEGFVSLGFLANSRLLLRLLQERMHPSDLARLRTFVQNPSRVLIVGAGDAGARVVREMQANPGLGMRPVGLVDDDPAKHRLRVHGVPVAGGRHAIPELVRQLQVNQIIIAMPTAPGKEIREIVHICEQAGVSPRTIPGIYELLDGTVSLSQLRSVDIEDLLRRDQIVTDIAAVRELLRGKRVLVTGGGGSIGSELCRQILRCRPAELVLLGHGENSIFEITNELRRTAAADPDGPARIRSLIADIRFGERVLALFRTVQPQVVFHAAAHKHVPLMEENPAEAITNNVLGTRNVLAAARAANVERFVMISTDKAVNPTSIMGASKRAAELLVHQTAEQTGKPYVAVRFGNVLGSRGSVVLTFKQQIAAGGPVTVTDPEMKRFFMTIPEAVQLVLQAGVLGHGGEVFLLDMGEPVRIVDLAHDLIKLSGLEVGRDIDVVFTGLRPGEKLFEELFVPGEEYRRTRHEKIFIAANASSFVPAGLDELIGVLEQAAQADDRTMIVRGLQSLIPEFHPPLETRQQAAVAPGPEAAAGVSRLAVDAGH